jgi:hypothetical protein
MQADDFSDLPLEDISEQMSLKPNKKQLQEKQFRQSLENVSPKALSLDNGRKILEQSQKGRSFSGNTGLEKSEAESLAKAVDAQPPDEQRAFRSFSKQSVFDLESGLQTLFEEVQDLLNYVHNNPEFRLGAVGEMRQLYKLAKDVMRDVAYVERERKKHEEDLQIVLEELNKLDPLVASRLFKAIEQRKSQRRIIGS